MLKTYFIFMPHQQNYYNTNSQLFIVMWRKCFSQQKIMFLLKLLQKMAKKTLKKKLMVLNHWCTYIYSNVSWI